MEHDEDMEGDVLLRMLMKEEEDREENAQDGEEEEKMRKRTTTWRKKDLKMKMVKNALIEKTVHQLSSTYATWHERRCFHLDPIEGGHRKVGVIQASLCTKYDFKRGSITDPTS